VLSALRDCDVVTTWCREWSRERSRFDVGRRKVLLAGKQWYPECISSTNYR